MPGKDRPFGLAKEGQAAASKTGDHSHPRTLSGALDHVAAERNKANQRLLAKGYRQWVAYDNAMVSSSKHGALLVGRQPSQTELTVGLVVQAKAGFYPDPEDPTSGGRSTLLPLRPGRLEDEVREYVVVATFFCGMFGKHLSPGTDRRPLDNRQIPHTLPPPSTSAGHGRWAG